VPHARMPAVPATLAALVVLGLSACSGEGGGNGAVVHEGDPDACPGEVVDVVVSVGQWSDVVQHAGGACATVTTIVSSGAVDPHDFDPSTGDIAAFGEADLVVVNGAGYDGWAESAVGNLDPEPAVVSAADVAGLAEHADEEHAENDPSEAEHSEEGGHGDTDPHLWYDPDVVAHTAEAVTESLTTLSPDAADYFAERAAAWQAEFRDCEQAVEGLRTLAAGRTYAATETVFDRMAATVGLTDVTPEGYRRAAGNESEPAPADLAAFEAALADGSVDVLIYNSQTRGSVPEQLRDAAEEAGVPVVEVTESPVDADGSFVAWQLAQLQQLSDALSATP